MSILVVDVGTSSIRTALVGADAVPDAVQSRPFLPDSPAPGLVEFDAAHLAALVLEAANATLDSHDGAVEAVGITNQRGSAVVWDRASGEPVAPAQGWQDLRTVFDCLARQADGLRLMPNTSASKLASILDTVDPDRRRDLCFGTVDSWIAWTLSQGADHVCDATNAAVTQMRDGTNRDWDDQVLEVLRVPPGMLPTVVDSSGPELGVARALPGSPPITALVGDQQASLLGQGCVEAGQAKITFGTGAMLDVVLDGAPVHDGGRGPRGTFPIVARRIAGVTTWGVEAVMLAAGTNVEWLVEDLGILGSAADSHTVAARCSSSEGVVYVPALLGLGTPEWDFGARGTLLGLTRGTTAPHIVRAVLEGVAHRGADLLDAATADAGRSIDSLRIDGGMSRNPTFVQALADATGRTVEVSREAEATTVGAAFLAGLAIGTWPDLAGVARTWDPAAVVEPTRQLDRERWREAVIRSGHWLPDLSTLEF